MKKDNTRAVETLCNPSHLAGAWCHNGREMRRQGYCPTVQGAVGQRILGQVEMIRWIEVEEKRTGSFSFRRLADFRGGEHQAVETA